MAQITTVDKRVKTITNIPGWVERLTANPNSVDTTALAYYYVPLVFRAIRMRANAVVSIPPKITKIGGEDEMDWPYPEPLANLVWRTSASLDLKGAAYWEIVANESQYQKNVKYRNPYDMTVDYKRAMNDQPSRILFKQTSTGAMWTNEPDNGVYQMVYFTEYDPAQDVLPGRGSAEVALGNAQLLRYLTRYASSYFESGAMPVTMLAMDGADQEEIDRTETFFKRFAAGVRNAFRVLGVRANTITPATLTPPMKDMVIPDLHAQARAEVALAFEIPQTMLEDAANYATALEHRLSFYEESIVPRAQQIADVMNQQLLAKDGLKIEFDHEKLAIFQEDEEQRAGSLNQLTSAGVPLVLAMDILGYDLDEKQKALLNAELLRKEQQAQEIRQNITNAQNNPPANEPDQDESNDQAMRLWLRKALKRLKKGQGAQCDFVHDDISLEDHDRIYAALAGCETAEDVKAVFADEPPAEHTKTDLLLTELIRANNLLEMAENG